MEAAAQQVKDQAELNELLCWAAARGLLADAEELVARGAELLARDKQGYCAAHYAAAHGHTDVLQYLTAKGADLEAEDGQARLPLHHAAASPSSSVDALQYLMQQTTWLGAPDAADNTALHLAARRGWVPGIKALLARGAEVDTPNKRGLSALGEAVAGGHTDAAAALLAAGAAADWRADGYTLLHVAAGLGRTDTLRLLLEQPGCAAATWVNDSHNGDGATALHAAAMAGCLPAAELLLAKGAEASLAGAGDLQAWQLVTEGQPDQQEQQQQQWQQQQLQQKQAQAGGNQQEKLRQLLQKAAGGRRTKAAAAAAVASPAKGTAVTAASGSAGHSTGAQLDPVEAYSQSFMALDAAEQARKVEGFARLPPSELGQLLYLSPAAQGAVAQVRRARQLLSVYSAVAALRADEAFQEDAADPAVQAALTDMGLHNNMDKYAAQRQVVSVANKLKKFHSVLQEAGGIKLGLPDLLVPPGQTLEELCRKDAQQVQQLTKAAGEARAAAVAAIAGQPLPRGRSAGAPTAVAAGGCEIEPAEGTGTSAAAVTGAHAADTDLDRELQQHRQAGAAGGLKPGAVDPDSMSVGRRIVYELVESFKRAMKIMAMMALVFGLMWCFGMLPSQQDPQVLEERMRQMAGGGQQAAHAAQQQQQQPVTGLGAEQRAAAHGGGGGEL